MGEPMPGFNRAECSYERRGETEMSRTFDAAEDLEEKIKRRADELFLIACQLAESTAPSTLVLSEPLPKESLEDLGLRFMCLVLPAYTHAGSVGARKAAAKLADEIIDRARTYATEVARSQLS